MRKVRQDGGIHYHVNVLRAMVSIYNAKVKNVILSAKLTDFITEFYRCGWGFFRGQQFSVFYIPGSLLCRSSFIGLFTHFFPTNVGQERVMSPKNEATFQGWVIGQSRLLLTRD